MSPKTEQLHQLAEAIYHNNVDKFKHLLGGELSLALTRIPNPCPNAWFKWVTLYELAVEQCRHGILGHLLLLGIDVNHRHNAGYTLLYRLVLTGYSDTERVRCARLLLSQKNVNINDVDGSNWAPLVAAARIDKNKKKKKQQQDNIDVNCRCGYLEFTPLISAICHMQTKNVRHLMQHKNIDVNLCTHNGVRRLRDFSALHYVCVERAYEQELMCARQLLNDTKVDVNRMSCSGTTPVQYACNKQNYLLMALLVHKAFFVI